MSRFQRNLRIGIAVIILAAAGLFSFFYWGKYSEGFRSGVVMKVSHKGKIFKTYEGELRLDAAETSHDGTRDMVWYFSVPKQHSDVVEQLRQASLSGNRVELDYYERYWKVPWRGKTKYFVTGVTVE